MNKKGQVLVIFLLLLPLLFLALTFVYDMGNLYYQKAKLKSSLKDSAIYLLNSKTIDDETKTKAINLVKKNVATDSVQITNINNQVQLEGKMTVKTNLLKNQIIKVKITGIKDGKIKIREE